MKNHEVLRIVILGAGSGRRLGLGIPKPSLELPDGSSILGRTVRIIENVLADDFELAIVTGFRPELFDEWKGSATLIHNPDFASTNTAVSLRLALSRLAPGPVLWVNGDVVFSENAFKIVVSNLGQGQSFCTVIPGQTGAEEVKYWARENGDIQSIGKNVVPAHGEAVGINFVTAGDRYTLFRSLSDADEQAFFEGSLNALLQSQEINLKSLEIGQLDAIEIDTNEDFERCKSIFFGPRNSTGTGM